MLAGGISVGDYDFVLQAATECGVQKLFHKVKQRPGKPLYFGKRKLSWCLVCPVTRHQCSHVFINMLSRPWRN